jgi:hypothetical protein
MHGIPSIDGPSASSTGQTRSTRPRRRALHGGRARQLRKDPQLLLRPARRGHEYSGFANDWDHVVFRGDPADGEFIAFWLKDRRVLAGMNVNDWDVNEQVQALIRAGEQVDVGALRDADTELHGLVAGPA